jgi:hypothetical protein
MVRMGRSPATLRVVTYASGAGYFLSARHLASVTWYYDNAGGGLQPKGSAACPVTVAGVSGDSVTG